jgi:CMP-N,N'-diacetyllegionaminic acid synthase
MRIICTICARKGSRGIKNKNLVKINGKPLILHTLEQAKKINFIDTIVVSTDSKKIQKLVGKKYSWFLRPKQLSDHKSSKILAIRHGLEMTEKKNNCKYDIIIDLDITSPLRIKSDIINSFKKFEKNKLKNLFSVCHPRKNPYFNIVELKKTKKTRYAPVKNYRNFYSRQSAPVVYEMNAAIYIWKRKSLISKRPLFNNKSGIFVMPRERSFDIDDKLDLKLVKFLKK